MKIRKNNKIKGFKMFYARHTETLEREINEFLKDKDIELISNVSKFKVDENGKIHFVVFLFYR